MLNRRVKKNARRVHDGTDPAARRVETILPVHMRDVRMENHSALKDQAQGRAAHSQT
jgi:hypothetical protein